MKTKTENDEMHVMDVYHFFFFAVLDMNYVS